MTRQKVKLEYTSNDSARKATFRKRQIKIIQKVNDLVILCGIETCALLFSPFDSKTEVWPKPEGAKQVIERYQKANVANDGGANVNPEILLRQRIARANEQLEKLRKENHEKEMTLLMFQALKGESLPENLTFEDMNDIQSIIEAKIEEIEKKMAAL